MEGRSYKEIASILGSSVTALETLIFRARRSLAEELENLVTCDRAELALSLHSDGRLGRKERKRLVAHLAECPGCARVAKLAIIRRHAFKGLALLPLPLSLTLFKGAPAAYAAVGLPTIGAGAATGTAAGVGGGALVAKVAVGIAAVAVAGGAGYEGVKVVRGPASPDRPAKAAPAAAVPAAQPAAVHDEPHRHEGDPDRRQARLGQDRSRQAGSRRAAASHDSGARPQRVGARADEDHDEGGADARKERDGSRPRQDGAGGQGDAESAARPAEGGSDPRQERERAWTDAPPRQAEGEEAALAGFLA